MAKTVEWENGACKKKITFHLVTSIQTYYNIIYQTFIANENNEDSSFCDFNARYVTSR